MAVLLAGCGSKTDANEKNFSAAIEQYLDKKGELCLNITRWPVDVDAMELRLQKTLPTATAGRMAALEAVGLVTGADIEIEAVGFDGKPNGGMLKVKRYTMTDAAKPFARTEEVERFGAKGKTRETRTDLCWGKKVLHNVVKWEGPRTFGDYQEALVQYQYKIDGLAEWAKKPEFLVAFPGIGRMVDDPAKKEQHIVKLTNLGWEAAGLDN
jgi:hypothetical protein